jgi:hypothetical protein
MLEAILVPVVKKAVDFLFDEGRDVVKAYLRRHNQPAEARDEFADNSEPVAILAPSKDEALRKQVDEAIVERYRSDLEHLLRLQEIQTRNYHLAMEQEAQWSKELVPSIIINRIISAEKDLADTTRRMAVACLSG